MKGKPERACLFFLILRKLVVGSPAKAFNFYHGQS
jgi:hypothetical protein